MTCSRPSGLRPTQWSSVTAWLRGAGITSFQADGAFVDFTADLATVNSLFNASFKHYTSGSVTKLRTTSYTIPDEVASHITLVDPSIYFGSTTAQSSVPPSHYRPSKRSPAPDSCQMSLTPACLKQLYNVGNYTADPSSGSKIGFGSFLNQSASIADTLLVRDRLQHP